MGRFVECEDPDTDETVVPIVGGPFDGSTAKLAGCRYRATLKLGVRKGRRQPEPITCDYILAKDASGALRYVLPGLL